MGIKINTNTISQLVQRTLDRNSRQFEISSERISSGTRINRSADDPAGLALSETLRYEIQGVRQNQQNVGGALSLIGVADSNSANVVDLLQRARELVVQAGNDTLNAANRQTLQGEMNQILAELDRIASSTRYNERTLFDGTFQGIRVQVGTKQSEFLALSLGDYRTRSLGARAAITSANPVGNTALAAGQVKINGIDVPDSRTDGVSAFFPAASATAKAAAINEIEGQTGVHAEAIPASLSGVAAIQNIMLDGVVHSLSINGVKIPTTNVLNGDSNRSLTTSINALTNVTGVKASIDVSGVLTLTGIDGRNVRVEATGNAAQRLGLSAAPGDLTVDLSGKVELSSGQPFMVEDPANLVGIGATQNVAPDPTTALENLNITTTQGVAKALRSIDTALSQISGERSRLGALTNRLEGLTETLAQRVEDLTGSDSRIRDTDFAFETARLTQAEILQEASISMLTQANIIPRKALELLRG